MRKPAVVGACAAACLTPLLSVPAAHTSTPDTGPTPTGLAVPARLVDRRATVRTTYRSGKTTTRTLTLESTLTVPHLERARNVTLSTRAGRQLLVYKPTKGKDCTEGQPTPETSTEPQPVPSVSPDPFCDDDSCDDDDLDDDFAEDTNENDDEGERSAVSAARRSGSGKSHRQVVRFPAPSHCTPATTPAPAPADPTPSTPSTVTGNFLGAVTNPGYGPIQVSIHVTGGHIDAVTAVQYPTDLAKSARINTAAIPKLQIAALAAQSADIAGVSGATYTSKGFRTSLQSALTKAEL